MEEGTRFLDTHKMVASMMRLFAATLFALPIVKALVLHEQVHTVPAGWSLSSAPDNDTQIVLQVALAQQNIDQLESRLSSVSTPGSSSYGQYLDLGDINALFSPSDASKNAVTAWLNSSGINTYTAQGDSVWLKASVAQANSLLGTTFNTYTDAQGMSKIRTTQYSIPQALKAHIDLVSPTTYFGTTQPMRSIKSTYSRPRRSLVERATTLPAGCNSTIVYQNHSYPGLTPDCLRYIYNVKDYKPDVKSGSKIAFSSFLNESASFSDLFAYEGHFGIAPQKLVVPRTWFPPTCPQLTSLSSFSVVLVNPEDGATDLPQPPPDADDGEANLDVQNIVAISHPLPITEYITAGSP
jgi:tripeptidyl-peptidase-1